MAKIEKEKIKIVNCPICSRHHMRASMAFCDHCRKSMVRFNEKHGDFVIPGILIWAAKRARGERT